MKVLFIIFMALTALACSSSKKVAQKAEPSAVHQRVPLSDDQKKQIVKAGKPIVAAMERSLRFSLQEIAKPEFKITVKSSQEQPYALTSVLTGGGLALMALGVGLMLPAVGAGMPLVGPLVAPTVFMTGPLSLVGGLLTHENTSPETNSPNSWAQRIKIKYTAVHRTDRAMASMEGHCSAYFFSSQNAEANRIQLHTHKGKTTGFTAPWEIDGCTHESIFPENKPGKLRINAGQHDPTDWLLGQLNVVANGHIKVSLAEASDPAYPRVLINTHITSHNKKLPTFKILGRSLDYKVFGRSSN